MDQYTSVMMLVEQKGQWIGLTEAEAQLGHRGCSNISARSDRIKLPRFSAFMIMTLFQCQFEAMVGHLRSEVGSDILRTDYTSLSKAKEDYNH
jgi:hypothetical protein